MDLEKLVKIPDRIRGFDVNSQGNKIALSVNLRKNFDICIFDINKKSLEPITSNIGICGFPSFSPDGNKIVFQVDLKGEEKSNICMWSKKGIKFIVENEHNNIQPIWSPDGETILYISDRNSIWIKSIKENKTERLIKRDSTIWSFAVSPNGEIIVFASGNSGETKLFWYSIKNKKIKELKIKNSGEKEFYPFTILASNFSPDSKQFIFAANPIDMFDIGIYSFYKGTTDWIVKNNHKKLPLSFSPSGREIVYLEFKKGHYFLKTIPFKNGKEIKLLLDNEFGYGNTKWISDKELIAFAYSYFSPPKLCKIGKTKMEDIVSFSPSDICKDDFVKPEFIEYKSFDGLKIPAILYRCKKDRGKALLNLHGGPRVNGDVGWEPYVQYLAYHGYTVLMPDYRGSTGYGRKYQDLNKGDLGGGDLKDIIWGAKWLKKHKFVENNSIGIFGLSYGGYLTLLALSKYPNLWKAGVCICGVYNWVTQYKNTRGFIRSFIEKHFGKPEDNPGLYRERSPITYIDNIKAKCLLIHGKHDARCPIEQLLETKNKLSKLCELFIYPDEGHGIIKTKNKIDLYKRMVKFFDSYL